MWFLAAVILLNTYLAIIFKLFPRFGINALQAIVVNYWICVITGSLVNGSFPISTESLGQAWLPYAMIMGLFFITLFNLIAWSTAKSGITPTAVANKLSLVIPALFAVIWYHESFDGWKIAGVILAFPAVYLSARSKDESGHLKTRMLWPILIFIGSGLLDALVTFITRQFFSKGISNLDNSGNATFLSHAFATAAVMGSLLLIYLFLTGRQKPSFRNLLAGILVGIPNFFSMYFLVRLLNNNFLQASAAIPVSNIAVVLIASLAAIFVFKEKAKTPRIIGLILSVLAILMILLSDLNGATS